MNHPTKPILKAVEGCQQIADSWLATTNEPWLAICPPEAITNRRWVRLRYSSSFMDEPVRPLIRFKTKSGEVFVEPMNGAILGSAEWLGRIPEDTTDVAISPSRRLGRFDFRIESIESEYTFRLVLRGIFRSRLWTYWTLRCLTLGARREAWSALKSATEGTSFKDYANWHHKNARRPDFRGFDSSREGSLKGPRFVVFLIVRDADPKALLRTVQSLINQSYDRFVIGIEADDNAPDNALGGSLEPGGSIRNFYGVGADQNLKVLETSIADGDWLTELRAGDELRPYAMAALAEELANRPGIEAIYADEDCITDSGKLHSPFLKPDWSPVYQAQVKYVQRALFVNFAAIPPVTWQAGALPADLLISVLDLLPPDKIHHLRRIIYSRDAVINSDSLIPLQSLSGVPGCSALPAVSIVVPTKDRANLLATCIKDIKEQTDYPNIEIVVVDNGSTATDAVCLLEALQVEKNIKVIRSPGRFNFSKLCNIGAAQSTNPILLFLNNDTEVRGNRGWLKAMIRWAVQSQIGAVGAKLFFADGRVQHAGVVLGLSGIAGHAYLHQRENHKRTDGRLNTAKEVSAVTGACLAISREKFLAVGGFDERLAVDLNDIDLCLRLGERGWRCIWTPGAELIHRESSSRGLAKNYFEEYRSEITLFVGRWQNKIRDDPFFHPGLSLYAHDIRLA